MDEDKYFGKKVTLTGEVVPVEADESFKVHMKCSEYVCKMYKEIGETGTSTMNIQDLIKDIENG